MHVTCYGGHNRSPHSLCGGDSLFLHAALLLLTCVRASHL